MLALICGLTAEAALAKALGIPAFAGGGTPEGARTQALDAIRGGATGLISFGLAGGLDPGLQAGAVLRPAAVMWRQNRFDTHPALTASLGGATCAALWAGETVVTAAAEKRALWKNAGASAIDLESGAVAEQALLHGVAFAVLRAVCDPAGQDLPPAALAALNAAGAIGILRVARSVLGHPRQIPALLALAGNAGRARKALAGEVAGLSARGALAPWL